MAKVTIDQIKEIINIFTESGIDEAQCELLLKSLMLPGLLKQFVMDSQIQVKTRDLEAKFDFKKAREAIKKMYPTKEAQKEAGFSLNTYEKNNYFKKLSSVTYHMIDFTREMTASEAEIILRANGYRLGNFVNLLLLKQNYESKSEKPPEYGIVACVEDKTARAAKVFPMYKDGKIEMVTGPWPKGTRFIAIKER